MLQIISVLTLVLLFLRFSYLQWHIWNERRQQSSRLFSRTSNTVHLMAVFGSGGHTKEMITLVGGLEAKFTPRSYIVADSDKLSAKKIRDLHLTLKDDIYTMYTLPRSRKLHQSYLSSIFTSLKALAFALPLVVYAKPDVLIVNGPGTCIPVCIAAYIIKFVCFRNIKIIYVESICRVTSLSLSGHLLYYFVDSFVVQWPELVQRFSMTKFIGKIM